MSVNSMDETKLLNLDETVEGGVIPKARLICMDQEIKGSDGEPLVIALSSDAVTVGRGTGNSIVINSSLVSRNHARIHFVNNTWVVEDLGSTNGLWVDDQRMPKIQLQHDIYLKIGGIFFRFLYDRPDITGTSNGMEMGADSDQEEDGGSEKTLFLGSNASLAADVLKDAQTTRRQAEKVSDHRHQAVAHPSRGKSSVSAHGQVSESKGRGWIWVTMMVLVVGIGGGAWMFLSGGAGEKEQALLSKGIHNFETDMATISGQPSNSEIRNQIKQLEGMVSDAQIYLGQFPKNDAIPGMTARLVALHVVMQLHFLFADGQFKEADALVDEAVQRVRGLSGRKGDTLASEALDVLALAQNVIVLKKMGHEFSQPSATSVKKPSMDDLLAFNNTRKNFIENKKKSTTHVALGLHYPFFERMVKAVDNRELGLVELWNNVLNR